MQYLGYSNLTLAPEATVNSPTAALLLCVKVTLFINRTFCAAEMVGAMLKAPLMVRLPKNKKISLTGSPAKGWYMVKSALVVVIVAAGSRYTAG